MKKILFILVNPLSHDETFGIDNFVKGLSDDYEFYCLAPLFPATYLLNHQNIKTTTLASSIDMEHKEINDIKSFDDWKKYYDSIKPDVVFLVDPEFIITAESNLVFKRTWLSIIECPIGILEYHDRLAVTKKGYLTLKNADKLPAKVHTLKIPFTRVIACPPNRPVLSLTTEKAPLYLKNEEPFSNLAMYSIKSSLYEELRCSDDNKIVMLFFSHQAMLEGIIANMSTGYHYKAVIETLVHYFEQVGAPIQLLVFNVPKIEEIKSEKVHIHYFPSLSIEGYKHWIKAADLLLVESITHPALIDAAAINVPAVVLANSVTFKEKDGQKILVSEMGKIPTKFVWDKMNELLNIAPEVLINYVSFPHKTTRWTEKKFISDNFAYYFADLFNEPKTLSLLNELLMDTKAIENTKKLLTEYLLNSTELTQTAEDIVKTILSAQR